MSADGHPRKNSTVPSDNASIGPYTRGMTILLRSGAMHNMDPNLAVELAREALEQGYKVRLFLYSEGVTNLKAAMAPKRFPNIAAMLEALIEAYGPESEPARRWERVPLKVAACKTCFGARGLLEGEAVVGADIGTLTHELAAYVAETQRLVTIGR